MLSLATVSRLEGTVFRVSSFNGTHPSNHGLRNCRSEHHHRKFPSRWIWMIHISLPGWNQAPIIVISQSKAVLHVQQANFASYSLAHLMAQIPLNTTLYLPLPEMIWIC